MTAEALLSGPQPRAPLRRGLARQVWCPALVRLAPCVASFAVTERQASSGHWHRGAFDDDDFTLLLSSLQSWLRISGFDFRDFSVCLPATLV